MANNPVITKIAAKALRRIIDKNWSLEGTLKRDARIEALSVPDKRLLRELLVLTVRHLGEIDKFLTGFTKHIDNLMRFGVAQIILLELPRGQVIENIMAAAKENKQVYSTVLNRLDQKVFTRDAKLNYPNWMQGTWRKAYGATRAAEIMQAMVEDAAGEKPKLPEADLVIEAINSETGLIALKPELMRKSKLEDALAFAKKQSKLIEEAYGQLKTGTILVYANNSLQYEEGEGLVRKLDTKKWLVLAQKRVLPCDPGSGGIGSFYAKLKKIA